MVIIGGGPGGYVAAIKAAQLGFKVSDDLHGYSKPKTDFIRLPVLRNEVLLVALV